MTRGMSRGWPDGLAPAVARHQASWGAAAGATGGVWGPMAPPSIPALPTADRIPAPRFDLAGGSPEAQSIARTSETAVHDDPPEGEDGSRDILTVPGVNDLLDFANGLAAPSVQKAGDAAKRHAELASHMKLQDAVRRRMDKGAARSRANKAYFEARRQARAANRLRLSTANALPAKYLPRSFLYDMNQTLKPGVAVLGRIPIISLPLAGVGFYMDQKRMSAGKAAAKNLASTAAGIGAVVAVGAVGAPVLVGVAVGAVVGYGVGLAVEHWGDDVAAAATSVARGVGDAAGKASEAVGDAAHEAKAAVGDAAGDAREAIGDAADGAKGKARDLWARLGG